MSSVAAVGTRAWAARTRGALSRGEALRLARQAALAQIAGLPSQVRARLGRGRGGESALLSGREPPDSAVAQASIELAREAIPAPLLGHSLRCWLFADLFARHDRLSYDDELLYVSCVLHDLALSEGHRPSAVAAEPGRPARCFAVHGGELARDRLVGWGAPARFAEQAAEAITLHMNVEVPPRFGGEARLLHAAAHLDVGGARAGDLPAGAIDEVLRLHPRDGFGVHFAQLMRREASERPRSRAALLWKLGMPLAISQNPLDGNR
jgi:hypothetical protein